MRRHCRPDLPATIGTPPAGLERCVGGPAPPAADALGADDLVLPLRLRTRHGELAFFTTIATLGTATDVTLEELSIELFYPLDEHTRDVLAGLARDGAPTS